MPTTDSYQVGTDGATVKVSAQVSTGGIAATITGFLNGTTITPLPDCDDDDAGNINNCTVGVNTAIKGKTLRIKTSVDLQDVPAGQWQTMFDSLRIDYTLQGGDDGTKNYTYADSEKTKDSTGQFITVKKTINLV
jgi:hypothetical protein